MAGRGADCEGTEGTGMMIRWAAPGARRANCGVTGTAGVTAPVGMSRRRRMQLNGTAGKFIRQTPRIAV